MCAGEETQIDHRYAGAIEKGWDELQNRKLVELAELSGGSIEGDKLKIRILNRTAMADIKDRDLKWQDGSEIDDDLKVLFLHYLTRAEGKIDGKWASYREFEGGNLYYSVFQGRAIAPLIQTFGEDPEALLRAGERLGGDSTERGDASVNFNFFPYLMINVTVWEGDEEVPASANILFDSSTGRMLPAEDLAHLCADLISMLRAAKE